MTGKLVDTIKKLIDFILLFEATTDFVMLSGSLLKENHFDMT